MLPDERDASGWVMKALREAGYSLIGEIQGLDEDTLTQTPAEGEWCVKEIAAHLRDAELLALKQMTAIVEGKGTLPAWDIDLLPAERDYRSAEVLTVLRELRDLRNETAHLLWGLFDSDWQSSGEHPYRGRVSIETIARELAQHDLEHLWQVRQLKFELEQTEKRVRRDRPGV